MTAADWLNRSVSRLAGDKKTVKTGASGPESGQDPSKKGGIASKSEALPGGRSTRERLSATLRQKEEALSPRVLRRTLQELQSIVDPQVSEVEGGRRARGVAGWYEEYNPNCDNGIVDSGEACDDGNAVSGDGCSSVSSL